MKSNSALFGNFTTVKKKRSSTSEFHQLAPSSPVAVGVDAKPVNTIAAEHKQNIKTRVVKGKRRRKKPKRPIFSKKGHVTLRSISARREFFLGKSVARIEHELRTHGYEVTRKSSKHKSSKAKIVLTLNPSKDRNIKQIQISPGSARHGNVPYVKISTSDYGKIKIVAADRKAYKTDGHEKAVILFRRRK